MHEHPVLWKVRTRWAAVGAAVAVVAGAGGIAVSGATNAELTPSLTGLSPCRIMDTRSPGTVGPRSTPLGTNETHTIQVTGKNGNCNLPSDTSLVMLNVTLVNPSQGGFITVFPSGTTRPNASNLNYVAGQAPTPNQVTATLGADGRLSFFASFGPVDLVADVVAYTRTARLSTDQLAQNRWDKDLGRPATVNVGSFPNGAAFDGSSMWIVNSGADTVSKVDPATNAVTSTVTVGTSPQGVAFDGTSLWVANRGSNTVSKINPTTNTVIATVPVGASPSYAVFDGTSLWVTNSGSNTVSKVDPTTNTVSANVTVGTDPAGLAFDGTNLWVANFQSGTVSKINPTTNAVVVTVTVGTNPNSVAYDGSNVWVTNSGSNTVSKINPVVALAGLAVTATVDVDINPRGLAFDGTNLWVANNLSGTVSKIDPTSNTVSAAVPVGTNPNQVAFDGTNLWVTRPFSGVVSKIRAS